MTNAPVSSRRPRLLAPWRTACQWLTTLFVLLIPFAGIEGVGLLRVDFATLSMHLAGVVLPIEALWLLLLVTLAGVLLFLLVTLVFGRAWCGWGCPQTTLVDLVEWCARRIGVQVSAGTLPAAPWQRGALQLLYLALALLVGANLTWYFIPPREFFPLLAAGALHWSAWVLLGTTAAIVYFDLALLRRLFCKEFCPYGRFQTALVDRGTLTLRYHPDEAPRCIRCGACARACPTGIDIRAGDQIECINCGRCLDACRRVMARRGQGGIIRYTFGVEGRGPLALLNARTLLVALALAGVVAGLAVAATQRSPLTLKIARNAALLPRTVGEERVVNFFTAYLVNRGSRLQVAEFAVDAGSLPLRWHGPVEPLRLEAGAHRRVDFGIEVDAGELTPPREIALRLRSADGATLAVSTLTLTAPLDRGRATGAQ